jgi:hypothetical protein
MGMISRGRALWPLLAASLVCGCGGRSHGGDQSSTLRVLPVDGGQDLVGVWVGEVEHTVTAIENSGPSAGPEHVVLVLSNADGRLSGSVVFGDHSPPQPATDPEAFYPPITPAPTGALQTGQFIALLRQPFDGEPYSLFDVRQTATRITFEILPAELWKGWCALQTMTYEVSEASMLNYGEFTCAPDSLATASPEVGKAGLCLSGGVGSGLPCLCDQTSCHADLTGNGNIETFDLELDEGVLEGVMPSFSPSGIWSYGVKLHRVE